MSVPDLTGATSALATLLGGLGDDQLDSPTPCACSVRHLVAHVHGLSQAFTAAATKDFGDVTSSPPALVDGVLPDDWRDSTPALLMELGEAWRDPAAWEGMSAAGGIELPAEIAGLVALDEIVIHGWDIARSTGRPFDPGPAAVEVVHGFLVESRKGPVDPGLFGPAVDVATSAPLLDRAVGLAGRDPRWTA